MNIGIVLINFVSLFVQILTWAIIIRALLSWFSIGGAQPLFRLLIEVTEPVLVPIRRVLPGAGMIDFSPLIAILLLQFIGNIIVAQLAHLLLS